jgi:hypothetical protein
MFRAWKDRNKAKTKVTPVQTLLGSLGVANIMAAIDFRSRPIKTASVVLQERVTRLF